MTARRAFLVGPRGSGKSTVARLMAGRLGWSWLDADVVLERRAGQTVREIFASEGEAGFRRRESELLAELCGLDHHVIATGGGVVLSAENRERLTRSGVVFWLTGSAEALWRRICADASTAERRPALAGGGLAEVEQILTAREPLYRACAAHAIDTTTATPEEVAERIVGLLEFRPDRDH